MMDRRDDTQVADTVVAGNERELSVGSLDGQVLANRYRILGVLGQGGMGTVYRVRDQALDEIVALKTLRRDWIAAPGALERFRSEVKLARRVTHANVARTFDLGEHEGEPFLTMELIEGSSLGRELAERGRLAIERAVAIAAAVAEALSAAHAVGVVHRDLKPDNVLLGSSGRVVITDFGIARVDAGDAGATGAGMVVGTPAYMSPEQVQAEPVDARSDLYALGLLLFEMLTGRRAFEGASPLAVATARLVQPPPDPRVREPSVPTELAELTLRLLSREPASRPASSEVLSMLGQATDSEGGSAGVLPARRPTDSEGGSAGVLPARRPTGSAVRSAELRSPPRMAQGGRTLAAYPLRNAGPEEDRWIGEGLTADMFDALCTVRGLRMKAQTAIVAGETPHDFARRCGVELLLEGSVRRFGERVRLVLRLTSVDDGFQVWADRIECRLGDLLTVSDTVASAVADAVGRSGPVGQARAAVESGAVELYLRAREVQRRLAFSWREAASLLARAHSIAPDDPTIAAYYADVLSAGIFDPQEPGEDRLGTARRAAERALDMAPHLAEPWFAVARVRYNGGDTGGAARALRRSLVNGPSAANAHDLAGRILTEIDRLDEPQSFLDRALAIDPSLGFATTDLIRIAVFRGDWEHAFGLLRGLADTPEFEVMAGFRLSLWLGRDLFEGRQLTLGEEEPLIRCAQRAVSGASLTASDREVLEGFVVSLRAHSRPVRFCCQVAAECCLAFGDRDAGLDYVRRSVAAGLEDLAWLRYCPSLAPLHAAGALSAEIATVQRRALDIGSAWDQSPIATPR